MVITFFRLLAVMSFGLSGVAFADIVKIELQSSDNSEIYNRANVSGSPLSIVLDDFGYVEEEFFVYGNANSYQWQNNQLRVYKSDLPYVTRILLRRPAKKSKFSGVLHVEAEHPMQGGTSHWLTINEYMVKRGDAYVSIGIGNDPRQRQVTSDSEFPTSQSEIFHWFDSDRYRALSWPEDDGIRYQVFAEVVQLLRSKHSDNPLKRMKPTTVLAGGWSFTGSFLRTYINYGFHQNYRQDSGAALIDGYLVGISSRWNGMGLLPINSDTAVTEKTNPLRELSAIDVPVIEFLTEFEVAAGDGPQAPDSDSLPGAHRLYELGAATHSDQQFLERGGNKLNRTHVVQLAERGYPVREIRGPLPGTGCSLPISDVPQGPLSRAAVDNLRRWVLEGVTPPHAPELKLDDAGRVMRGPLGNPIGGLPIAEFALPLGSYREVLTEDGPECSQSNGRPLIIRKDFSAEQLTLWYGSAEQYLRQYEALTNTLVSERWILEEDVPLLMKVTKEKVRQAFKH